MKKEKNKSKYIKCTNCKGKGGFGSGWNWDHGEGYEECIVCSGLGSIKEI